MEFQHHQMQNPEMQRISLSAAQVEGYHNYKVEAILLAITSTLSLQRQVFGLNERPR